MLIRLAPRILPHVVDFGYLVEPATGEPVRSLARGRQRETGGFPEGCHAVVLPGRVAGHVAALPGCLDGADGRHDALLIQPAFTADLETGLMKPAFVAAQRLTLDEAGISLARAGDSLSARGMVFDIAAFEASAPGLAADLFRLSETTAISVRLSGAERFGLPRAPLALAARPPRRVDDAGNAARMMIAALQAGVTLRLGRGDCADAMEFMAALADVYALLPPGLRGFVSASAGLTREDPAIQLSFSQNSPPAARMGHDPLGGLPASMLLEEAASHLFAAPDAGGIPLIECHGEGGILVSTRLDSRLGLALRRHMASCALQAPAEGSAHDLEALASAWPCDPVELAAARRGLERLDSAAASLAETLAPGGLARAALAILAGGFVSRPDAAALRFALELAAEAAPRSWLREGGRRAEALLRALIVNTRLIPPPMLGFLASGGAIAAATARMVAETDDAVARIVRRGVSLAEMMGPEAAAIARRARQTLPPLDGRVDADWRARGPNCADPFDLLAGLSRDASLLEEGRADAVRHLAATLAEQGRKADLTRAVRMSQDAAAAGSGEARQRIAEIGEICTAQLRRGWTGAASSGVVTPFRRVAGR